MWNLGTPIRAKIRQRKKNLQPNWQLEIASAGTIIAFVLPYKEGVLNFN